MKEQQHVHEGTTENPLASLAGSTARTGAQGGEYCAPTWDWDAATRAITAIQPVARGEGYIAAVYGSLLTSARGRDLDIALFAWRNGCALPTAMLRALATAVGGKPIGPPSRGLMGTVSQSIALPDLRIIEAVVLGAAAGGLYE